MSIINFDELSNEEKLFEEGNIILSRCQYSKSVSTKYILKKVKRKGAVISDNAIIIKSEINDEVQYIKQISHENLLYLIDTKVDNDYSYFLYEDANFLNLQKYFETGLTLNLDQVHVITKAILQALLPFHERNFSFKDFRFSNILIIINPYQSQIFTFGMKIKLSLLFTEQHLNKNNIFNWEQSKFAYFAPETIKHLVSTTSSDIWSLGVLVFSMLTKSAPFGSEKNEIINNINKGIYRFNKNQEITKDCLHFISLCLKKDPNKRSTLKGLMNHPFITKIPNDDLIKSIPYSTLTEEDTKIQISLTCNPDNVSIFLSEEECKMKFIANPNNNNTGNIETPLKPEIVRGSTSSIKEAKSNKTISFYDVPDEELNLINSRSVTSNPYSANKIPNKNIGGIEMQEFNKSETNYKVDCDKYFVQQDDLPESRIDYISICKLPNKLIIFDITRHREYHLSLGKKYYEFPVMSISEEGLYLSGGISSIEFYTSALRFIFLSLNPFNYRFEEKSSLCHDRSGHAAVILNSKDLCIVGGYNSRDTLSSCEVYDSSINKCLRIARLNNPRRYPGACSFKKNIIYAFGGWNPKSKYLNTIECLNFEEELCWKVIEKKMPYSASGVGCLQYKKTGILLFGGNVEGQKDESHLSNFFYKFFPDRKTLEIRKIEKKAPLDTSEHFIHSTCVLIEKMAYFYGQKGNILYSYFLKDKKLYKEYLALTKN